MDDIIDDIPFKYLKSTKEVKQVNNVNIQKIQNQIKNNKINENKNMYNIKKPVKTSSVIKEYFNLPYNNEDVKFLYESYNLSVKENEIWRCSYQRKEDLKQQKKKNDLKRTINT